MNIIIPDEKRRADAKHIEKIYGVDRNNPAMREAAEIAAVRTSEAIQKAENRRRYY